MSREPSGKTNAQNIAEYAHAWLQFRAQEGRRPTFHGHHLPFGDALMVQQMVDNAIEKVYDESEESQPDPAKYGITEERSEELRSEIVRLCKKAYDIRHRS